MLRLLVSAALVISLDVASGTYNSNKGPRCYDCNYAPSGYVLGKAGYSSGHVGYQSCALQTQSDRSSVDKWGCLSGTCFIRKDSNGLVYRGCANKENLPWGVSAQAQCQYQGDSKSLWWFCQGDLCNEGQLGNNAAMCGGVASSGSSSNELGSGSHQRLYGKSGKAQEGYGFVDSSDYQFLPDKSGKYLHISFDLNDVDDKYGYLATMCNGDCSKNPSGLFPFPEDDTKFIQCESGQHHGDPCTCCKATAIHCPKGTLYDDDIKVCVGSASHLQGYGLQ